MLKWTNYCYKRNESKKSVTRRNPVFMRVSERFVTLVHSLHDFEKKKKKKTYLAERVYKGKNCTKC